MAISINGTTGAITGIGSLNSSVDSTELGYVDGVTSAIQNQINNKASLVSPTLTGTVTIEKNFGKLYSVTSTSGTTTSYHDTGITAAQATADDTYSVSGIYDLYYAGFVNPSGNAFRTVVYGVIIIGTGTSGATISYADIYKPGLGFTNLTISAVFWDGTTERSSGFASTDQLRIKVTGSTSLPGYYPTLRLTKKL